MTNLFDISSMPISGEKVDDLLRYQNIEIKRIVSSERLELTTFCQEEAEWVVLLQGRAEILMDGTRHALQRGDYLFIPSLQEHMITKVEQGTLWLAIHIYERGIG